MKYYMAPMEGLTGYIYRNAYQKYFHDIDRYFTPFITNKKLDFTIVGKNNDLIKKAVFKLNSEGYNVKLVPNIGDLDIGQDCDILISTKKEYDIKNVSSRLNLIKILISDEDNDDYDMVLSENDFEFNLLDKIKEKYL